MFWLRLSGWLFVLLLIATAVVMVVGGRLPPVEHLTITSVIPAPPERLWPLLDDPSAQPRWRSDVSAVDPLPDADGLPCWSERHDRTIIPVCAITREPPHRLKLRTLPSRLPFNIERSFELTPDPNSPSATRVTVTETISIDPPMVRFYQHYLASQQSRLTRLLADLTQAATSPSGQAAPSH